MKRAGNFFISELDFDFEEETLKISFTEKSTQDVFVLERDSLEDDFLEYLNNCLENGDSIEWIPIKEI